MNTETKIKPMLAKMFDPAKAVFPCFMQPKINGVRCLWDGKTAWTKNGNSHNEAVRALLSNIDVGSAMALDGELYVHGWSFEQIVSAVKRSQPLTARLEYHVFDAVFQEDLPFVERFARLEQVIAGNPETPLILVTTLPCRNNDNLQNRYERFIVDGYEGLIYRRSGSLYRHSQSPDLMKLKAFCDAEFTIVGCEQGRGKAAGTPVFVCETDSGERFRVGMEGSYDYRKRLWRDRDMLIGKPLTVRYQELTERGIPRHPVGVAVRDYESGSDGVVITGQSRCGVKYEITVYK